MNENNLATPPVAPNPLPVIQPANNGSPGAAIQPAVVQAPVAVPAAPVNAPVAQVAPPPGAVMQPYAAQPVAAAPPAYVAQPAPVAVPQQIVVEAPPEPPTEAPEPVRFVHFTAYPHFVVVWSVIVLGIVFALFNWLVPEHYPERVASTLWMLSLFLVMIALGFDFDSSETAMIVMAGVVVFLSLQLVAFEWHVPVFAWIVGHLKMLEVRVSNATMLVVSIILGVPYLLMMLFARMNNHWTAVPGKLVRKTFGKSEEEIPINSTKTVNYHFYDIVTRWLCFGAGHLIVATDKGERKIGLVLWARKRDGDIEPFETMPISGAAAKHD